MSRSTIHIGQSAHRACTPKLINHYLPREGLDDREAHHRSGTPSHRRLDRSVLRGHGRICLGGDHPLVVAPRPRGGARLRAACPGHHHRLYRAGGLAPAQRAADARTPRRAGA